MAKSADHKVTWSAGALACGGKGVVQRSRGRLRFTIIVEEDNRLAAMSSFYKRNLPHIEKDGASYFVSFSTRWEFVLPEEARTLIFDHCLFENGRKAQIHAFVVMPTHVHLLFTPLENDKGEPFPVSEIMQGIKGSSSHSVNKLLDKRGTLWEAESFDRIPRSDHDFEYRLLYIVENPIVAGLAKGPDDYRWAWRESAQPSAATIHKSK